MNNEKDMKFNIITECANRILSFQADLKKTNSEEEKEQLNFFISEQEQLIKECTDSPIDYILRYTTKLNDVKRTLETEQDPKRRTMLENAMNVYTEFIKSNIKDEPLIQENNESKTASSTKSTDKCAKYRASQKYDLELLKLAKEVSQMCEEHQASLKAKHKKQQELFGRE